MDNNQIKNEDNKRKTKESVPVSFKISKTKFEQIKSIADDCDITYSAIIKMAINEWLNNHYKKEENA